MIAQCTCYVLHVHWTSMSARSLCRPCLLPPSQREGVEGTCKAAASRPRRNPVQALLSSRYDLSEFRHHRRRYFGSAVTNKGAHRERTKAN